jgi:hypothetical protein
MTTANPTVRNTAIYREFIQKIFNDGRLDKLHEFVPAEYTLHHPLPGTPSGPEANRHIVSMFREGFSDLKMGEEVPQKK